ncbi:MAG: SGNH/GDSL hydrolase family protein [Acidobacteria bacterium]|nr:SGNH/GDSL hydrolase family protein [Acidobacteriota bacterium]
MTRRLFALAGCAAVLGWGQTRVLIIGDSISIGYAPFVREQLAGKAQVERIEGNGADSANILARLDTWLARGPYDAIAFNCGLHDLKYTSAHQVPPEQYEANLARIVERLRATGAKLIWVTTTPVDDERHALRKAGFARHEKDVAAFNRIATPLMRRLKLPICDLHEGVAEFLGNDGVHYTEDGYRRLAEQVAGAILEQLK